MEKLLAFATPFLGPAAPAISMVIGFLKVFLDPRVWVVCALVGGGAYLKGYWKRGEICATEMQAGKSQAIAEARVRDAKARDIADKAAASALTNLATEKTKLEGELNAFKKLVDTKPDCNWSGAELERMQQ